MPVTLLKDVVPEVIMSLLLHFGRISGLVCAPIKATLVSAHLAVSRAGVVYVRGVRRRWRKSPALLRMLFCLPTSEHALGIQFRQCNRYLMTRQVFYGTAVSADH